VVTEDADQSLVIKAVVTDATPSAGTSATANWNTSDIITITAHGFATGLKGQVTSTTTLPTGISGSTDYFVAKLSADTFYLFDTLAHALAYAATGATTGKVNITNIEVGDHTFTPTALAGGSISVQGCVSAENDVWVDIPDCTESVTATGTFVWEFDVARYAKYRLQTTLTAGTLTVVADSLVRGG
jgi:hypothetical protein